MRNFRLLFFTFLILSLSGCASAPVRQGLPTYTISGTEYVSLVGLCERRGVSWEYDTLSRTVSVSKDAHRINMRVGDTLVLVDGLPQRQKYPVDFYKGEIVIPYRLKEEVFDRFFKAPAVSASVSLPLRGIKKVVIDAGHGGHDPGAIGRTGLREKDVNLDVARRLSKLFKEDGVEVVMTRAHDNFIALEKRVDITNSSRADLFISVHSNANRVRGLNGFEIYYVSSSVNDSRRAMQAAKNSYLKLDKGSLVQNSLALKATLWDMIYTSNRAESVSLAHSICKKISNGLGTKVLGTKNANFYVLKGAEIPAVLVEIGFLSNPAEERMLKNNYYRQQIAEAIERGVRDYANGYMLAEAR